MSQQKTNAGTRVIPMTNEVTEMFRAIIEDRPDYKVEKVVDGYTGISFSGQRWNAACSQCIGNTDSIIWSAGIMKSIRFRCPILPLMFADIHIVPIWQSPA